MSRQSITDNIGQIKTYYWTNDAWDTGYAVENLTDMLKSEYAAANSTNSPLVIVTHSWGTVLAYIVLEQNPDIVVDKFITMGSPLSVPPVINGVRGVIGSFTSLKLSLQGIYNINALRNIRTWNNYWTDCDVVSASIPAIDQSNIDVQSSSINPLTCHSWYYKDPETWNEILFDVLTTKPPLKIAFTPLTPSVLSDVTFTASGSLINSNTAYSWNFGESDSGSANTSTQDSPSYYYYNYGDHTVSLETTDSSKIALVVQPATATLPPAAGIKLYLPHLASIA